MNFLANKSFVFLSDRYEEWMGGCCISQGPIHAKIMSDTNANGIRFTVEDASTLRMKKSGSFAPINEGGMSMDMGTRLQYFNPLFVQEDPLELILCQVFYEGRTISYIRFAMSYPDRIIEFYGKTISFDSMARPEIPTSGRLPGFKKLFIDEIADRYRKLLKDNSVYLAIIDHQLACVSYSLRKLFTLKAMMDDPNSSLQEQVFKDTSSIIYQFYPISGGGALEIARNWYNQLASNTTRAEAFMEYYDKALTSGEQIDGHKVQTLFQLL